MAKAAMRRFKLKKDVGPHFEPNPDFNPEEQESEENFRDKEYKPGQVVKSKRNLDKLFVNKFEPLDPPPPNSRSSGGEAVSPDDDPERDRPVRDYEVARVNAADRHLTEDELEGSGSEDLAKPRSKEQMKKDKEASASKNALVTEEEGEEEDEESEGESGGEEASGEEEEEDVTSDFDKAEEGGLQVMKVGDKYHVHEKGEPEPMKGSKKGFTSKKKTQSFINDNVT